MFKNWALALFDVLCIMLIVTSAITVSAVGESESVTTQESIEESSISEQPSYSADDEFGFIDTSSENESLLSDSSVSDGTASSDLLESETSSAGESSSTVETSSDENSSDSASSKNTSSKKPIHSTGGHGGTFIDQDLTSSKQSSSTSSTASTDLIESLESYVEDEEDDENVDHYVANSKSASSAALKLIWIPIVLIVLCTGGLITANVMFRKKYPKKAEDGATRRSKTTRGAVRRRK